MRWWLEVRVLPPRPLLTMKIWNCEHDWRGSWGAYQTNYVIVVAETKEDALERAKLEIREVSSDQDWTITEIPTHEANAFYISGRSS